jgi:hypothetical protein
MGSTSNSIRRKKSLFGCQFIGTVVILICLSFQTACSNPTGNSSTSLASTSTETLEPSSTPAPTNTAYPTETTLPTTTSTTQPTSTETATPTTTPDAPFTVGSATFQPVNLPESFGDKTANEIAKGSGILDEALSTRFHLSEETGKVEYSFIMGDDGKYYVVDRFNGDHALAWDSSSKSWQKVTDAMIRFGHLFHGYDNNKIEYKQYRADIPGGISGSLNLRFTGNTKLTEVYINGQKSTFFTVQGVFRIDDKAYTAWVLVMPDDGKRYMLHKGRFDQGNQTTDGPNVVTVAELIQYDGAGEPGVYFALKYMANPAEIKNYSSNLSTSLPENPDYNTGDTYSMNRNLFRIALQNPDIYKKIWNGTITQDELDAVNLAWPNGYTSAYLTNK